MAIPNQALQKLLQEIDTRATVSSQNLSLAKSQLSAKQRTIRLLQLTVQQLGELPTGTRVYEGVGRMFVAEDVGAVVDRLQGEVKGVEGEVEGLKKRCQYLEVTVEKAMENLDKVLRM